MRVLVAVDRQLDADDFCWADEGEILFEGPVVCASQCGCERSLAGVASRKSTTTAEVRDLDLTEADICAIAARTGEESGWGTTLIHDLIQRTSRVAARYPTGTILRMTFDFDNEQWVYKPV